MKRILTTAMLLVLTAAIYAQKDVTKFLGIPVDGTKSAMIQKLKAKGFTYNSTYDWLEGEFNGRNVQVSVVTNNRKVWRIMVQDASTSNETDIKIRFNTLCKQFERNQKYMSLSDESQALSEEEDISYNMSVNNKRYEADYYQKPDTTLTKADVQQYALSKYTQEQLANPTEEITKDLFMYSLDLIRKKSVWFMINEKYGDYRILMYYDNEYNHSDGEDL